MSGFSELRIELCDIDSVLIQLKTPSCSFLDFVCELKLRCLVDRRAGCGSARVRVGVVSIIVLSASGPCASQLKANYRKPSYNNILRMIIYKLQSHRRCKN